ncbi:hypothetical protein G5V58_07695 [Nocardioides anomalus]|uniref:Uncharacterized protein n=1 Tax=Nocardioides anomalus TaxID=2712223 RepID=A0A6G6WCB3_9ACTN|nr:hypothetical protein [Nocardioides anomalus]QIG42680.1 hypothetical protein G5V58_07695 [Nocardioides anomalus]
MRATLMLADHAVVADGKLYINGGGWSVTGPDPVPSAIAVKVDVPWDQTNRTMSLRLLLIGQDGDPVLLPGPEGPTTVQIEGEAEVGRPAGLVPGADVDFPLAFQIGPLPLTPGQRYQWVLEIDGETRDDWRLTFTTRAAEPEGPATYVVDP